ncbi:hypothetical protein [Synechocystis sp. PCC 7509]|nr:hypothetical protein [Synechocystis sp. PCC 7509]
MAIEGFGLATPEFKGRSQLYRLIIRQSIDPRIVLLLTPGG